MAPSHGGVDARIRGENLSRPPISGPGLRGSRAQPSQRLEFGPCARSESRLTGNSPAPFFFRARPPPSLTAHDDDVVARDRHHARRIAHTGVRASFGG